MVKGPIAIIIPLLPFWIISWKSKNKPLIKIHLIGFGIILATTLPWIFIIFSRVNSEGNTLFHEFLVRFTSSATHKKNIFYYFYTVLFSVFPWSIFLIPALIHWNKNEKAPQSKYVFLVFSINFIWLSIMRSKQDHYLLPLIPIIPIFITYYLFNNKLQVTQSKPFNKIFTAIVVIAILANIILPIYVKSIDAIIRISILMILIYIIYSKWIKHLFTQNLLYRKLVLLLPLLISLEFTYIHNSIEMINNRDKRKQFVEIIKNKIPPNSNIVYFDKIDPVIIFYYGEVIKKN